VQQLLKAQRFLIQSLLSRVTGTGEYIPQIEGLRFLAMLMVLGHHAFAIYLEQTHRLGVEELPKDWPLVLSHHPLASWPMQLALGVPLFCVISGFVLTIPFARRYLNALKPPSTRIFLKRRFIRIHIPYVIVMTVRFLVIIAPAGQALNPLRYSGHTFDVYWPHLIASLFYVHGLVFAEPSWIGAIAWTLEIEVQFYLLLPVIANIFRIRSPRLRQGLLAALVLAAALFSQFVVQRSTDDRLNLSLLSQLHFFLAGVLLADVYLQPPRAFLLHKSIHDVVAALSFTGLIFVVHVAPRQAWTEPFLILLFYYATIHSFFFSNLFSLRALTLLGGMSYTTYLYHTLLLKKLLPWTTHVLPAQRSIWWDIPVQFAFVLPVIFLFCAVLFVCTERPFMILSQRKAQRVPVPVEEHVVT